MKILHAVMIGIFASAIGCGDDDKNNKNGNFSDLELFGDHFGTVAIVSTELIDAGLTLTAPNEPEDCFVQGDIYNTNGVCMTPTSYKGYARLLSMVQNDAPNHDASSARVAGVTPNVEGSAGEVITGSEFDMATENTFTSWNELWFNYEYKSLWDYVGAELYYQWITVFINNKYYTMLVPANEQPLTESSIFQSCIPEEARGSAVYAAADVLEDMTFKRGDYLFCVKDTDEECQAEDFKWFDKESKTLVSERPSNPRVNPWLANDPITCTQEGERFSLSIQGVPFAAQMTSQFKLYADWSHGVDSAQWPDEKGAFGEDPDPDRLADEEFEKPYLLYYHETSSGVKTEGTNMSLKFDFDLEDLVFIDGLDEEDLESATDEEIVESLYTKHDYFFERKALDGVVGWSPNHISGMQVTVDVTLTGGREPPESVD